MANGTIAPATVRAAGERGECECVCVCECMSMGVCECVSVRARARVRECARVSVRVFECWP